jgi:hypothetical protein
MKADNGRRKGDELVTALYPIRSRAIISEITDKFRSPKFFCKVSTIFESAVRARTATPVSKPEPAKLQGPVSKSPSLPKIELWQGFEIENCSVTARKQALVLASTRLAHIQYSYSSYDIS